MVTQNAIESALKNGILVVQDGEMIPVNGYITLTYIKQLDSFVLAYGSSQWNARYVRVEDYGKTWTMNTKKS